MARYYWISLATNGSPAPRVAAALMSRLALNGEDHGCEREVTLLQRDIVRLTVMSRSAVAGGIPTLAAEELIRIGDDNSERFSGLVHVPDVDRLNFNKLLGRALRLPLYNSFLLESELKFSPLFRDLVEDNA